MNNIRKAVQQGIPRILELYEELTEEKINVTSDTVKKVFNEVISMPNQEFLVIEVNGVVLSNIVYPTAIQNPNLTASGTIAAGTSGTVTLTLTGMAPLTAGTIDLSKLSCTLTPSS